MYLWEQNPESLLASGLVSLMPLVPLMGGEDVEGLLAACVGVVEVGLESLQERNEVLAVTGLLASLRDRQRVAEFFRRRSMMNLLQQTPLFQELARDIVQQAVQQAEQQGEQRVRIHILLHLLDRKLGPVPDDLRQQLQQLADPEQLERLIDAAVESATLDEFRNHL